MPPIIAITSRPVTKESVQLVMDCLKYVYSWGDFREAAINNLETAAAKWDISKVDKHLILKLPYDRIVYRWIDYRWDKMHKFLNTLHHDKCYDRGRQMYSFTMYKNVRQAEQYLVRDKGYGALLQYDLADMSGYAVPIVSVMRYLMNAIGCMSWCCI